MIDFNIEELLKNMLTQDASDLHLISRTEPQVRVDGSLKPLDLPKLTGKDIEEICLSLITEKQKEVFKENSELDFALVIPQIGRFRVNYYRALGDICASFRTVLTEMPSLDDIDAPDIYKKLVRREKGLILVTGPTGSGKSTTLAAMLNEINLTENKHIITIEDPVEFIHKNKKSIFSHRGVGEDTKSFAIALKYAMRQDPDIILVGEMRDKETIEAALTAAETGHLVFGTLHTSSAPATINRIIDAFNDSEQAQIRAMISTSLVAIIAQTLLPKIGGGRIAASEILITNYAISNLIREDKIHQIYSLMQIGQSNTGMQTQTQALIELLRDKDISSNTALRYANKVDEVLKVTQT